MLSNSRHHMLASMSIACVTFACVALYLIQRDPHPPHVGPSGSRLSNHSSESASTDPQPTEHMESVGQRSQAPISPPLEPPKDDSTDLKIPSNAVRDRVRSMIDMELGALRPQLEQSTARAGVDTKEYLKFLQDRLAIEEREGSLESLAQGRARIIKADDINKAIFGPGIPYTSRNVDGEHGPVWVAMPIPKDLFNLHDTINQTLASLVDDLIDQHNRLSEQERDAMKLAYTTGKPWLVEPSLLMQLRSKFEYAPDSNLLRRRNPK